MPLDDQIAQRQANFQAIRDLGVAVYPNAFAATASVSELVDRHGPSSSEALEAERHEVSVAGRILGIRAFGKASFLVLSFSSDWLYPPHESQRIVEALQAAGREVTYRNLRSSYGHDAFLLEEGRQTNLIRPYLARLRARTRR